MESESASKWLQLTVRTSTDAQESVENFLWELGSVGLSWEHVATGEVAVRAFFRESLPALLVSSAEDYIRELDSIFPGADLDRNIEASEVLETDWDQNWKQHFKPVFVGRKFLVHPGWCEPEAGSRFRVVIDPGMAFGTGSHGSTRGCLEAFEDLSAESLRSALDVGTGSGILAIALARLGARRVLAIDIDDRAVVAAGTNVEVNGVAGVVQVSSQPLAEIKERFMLVAANLIAGDLIDLADVLISRLGKNGALVLSGILEEQEDAVRVAYERKGHRNTQRFQNEEWVTLVVRPEGGQ